MKTIKESILTSTGSGKNAVSLDERASFIYKLMYSKVINSNKGETDIFGQELNPGDWFVSIGHTETSYRTYYEFTTFYIPEIVETYGRSGNKFESKNLKGELRAIKFYGDSREARMYTDYVADSPSGEKIKQPTTLKVSNIQGKIKWPIKNLTVK